MAGCLRVHTLLFIKYLLHAFGSPRIREKASATTVPCPSTLQIAEMKGGSVQGLTGVLRHLQRWLRHIQERVAGATTRKRG